MLTERAVVSDHFVFRATREEERWLWTGGSSDFLREEIKVRVASI
jgi:hypothetical protein